MPHRAVTLAIVVFWLATLGWFCQHDLWPRLRPGQRPPYTLDLDREVTPYNAPHYWNVYHNHIKIGYAQTWVLYRPKDVTYELLSRFNFKDFKVGPVQVRSMESRYRVTRDGRLRELDGRIEAGFAAEGKPDAVFHVHGTVEDGAFTPHWDLHSPLGNLKNDGDPVPVTDNTSILNPTQPWNRLTNLQENRTWRIELFDPLTGALDRVLPNVLGGNVGVRTLEAGVLQTAEDLSWDQQDVPCRVIEYRSPDGTYTGKTYVRKGPGKDDGLVLRQEMSHNDDNLALERVPDDHFARGQ